MQQKTKENVMSVKFNNGEIRENGQLLGKLSYNDEIRNRSGSLLGKTHDEEIRDRSGSLVGKVRDGKVYSKSGSSVGRVGDYMIDGMQHEKDVNIVACYHFFVKKFL